MAENPYLKEGRLADVIAAITTLGTYRYYKLTFDGWAERIANQPEDGDRWKTVLTEHPEFFRVGADDGKVSLVWRRQHPKRYNTKTSLEITREQYDNLEKDGKSKISRRPLEASEITALINIAINLNERALEKKKASMWWIPVFTAILGFLGALGGSLVGG